MTRLPHPQHTHVHAHTCTHTHTHTQYTSTYSKHDIQLRITHQILGAESSLGISCELGLKGPNLSQILFIQRYDYSTFSLIHKNYLKYFNNFPFSLSQVLFLIINTLWYKRPIFHSKVKWSWTLMLYRREKSTQNRSQTLTQEEKLSNT